MKKCILALIFATCMVQGKSDMKNFKIKKIVDLTHTLTAENPTWDGLCGFDLHTTRDYQESAGQSKSQALHLKKTGTGTHIDSPMHFFPHGSSVAEIPLESLIVKLYVIDVSLNASANYIVSTDDIVAFEKAHGIIEPNSLVIMYTGWSKYWSDAKKYRNETNEIMRFPTIAAEVAQLLIDRNVAGIGIDTLSPDSSDSGYPVHRIMLSNTKYIVENIAQANQLPPIGAYAVALPLKINATEAPVRIVGLVMAD